MKCLPKAFPAFSPFSFSSRCLYSAYVLLIICSWLYQYFHASIVFFRLAPCLCLWRTLKILVSYAVQYPILVYQQHFYRECYGFERAFFTHRRFLPYIPSFVTQMRSGKTHPGSSSVPALTKLSLPADARP